MNFEPRVPGICDLLLSGGVRWAQATFVRCLFMLLFSGILGRTSAEQSASQPSPESPPIRVYILAGQSNAEGYAHVQQFREGREPFPAAWKAQQGILYWMGKDAPAQSNLWTRLRVTDSGRFGPEIGFGLEMARLSPSDLGNLAIIKYASGGTGIARSQDYSDYIPSLVGFDDHGRNWHPPTDDSPAGNLYNALIGNVRLALETLKSSGRRWELAGFIWIQGEHEAGISRKMAEDYGRLLSLFIRSVRKDLDAPSLLVAIGEINSHSWAFGEIARREQLEVCSREPGLRLVKTVDLPRIEGDGAHFTADGMLLLGTRIAAAFQEHK